MPWGRWETVEVSKSVNRADRATWRSVCWLHVPMTTQSSPSAEQQFVLYQVVAARRLGLDSMMWQAPGLGLTAQAFLMTIALGPGTGQLAQITAGLLSAVVSFISVQLLMKHRHHELVDSIWLQDFEKKWHLPEVHAAASTRNGSISMNRLEKLRSHKVWIVGLGTFGLVGIGSAIAGFVG